MFILLLLSPCFLAGQEVASAFQCSASHVHERLLDADPEYRERTRKLNHAWAQAQSGGYAKRLPAIVSLPVVFNVLHQGGPENLSDKTLITALARLNAAFANTGFWNPDLGANTHIEFCLAERGMRDEPISGISRIRSPFTVTQYGEGSRQLSGISEYSSTDYINVFIVKDITDGDDGTVAAGYAYLPSSHGRSYDGMVIEAQYMQEEQDAVVFIHEMGHYLGLLHTFDNGCYNNNCYTDGDMVCDTPPDGSESARRCDDPENSCDTDVHSGFATDQPDLHSNYMDYGYWKCRNNFTEGQVDRMHFFLNGARRSLLSSNGCNDPCPVDPPTITFEITSQDCLNSPEGDGSLFVTSQSGRDLEIAWSNGATKDSLTDLKAGTYYIYANYPNGCVTYDSIVMPGAALPAISLNISHESCPGEDDASVTFADTSGWDSVYLNDADLLIDETPTYISPGDHYLRATSKHGCDTIIDFTVYPGIDYPFILPADRTLQIGDSILLRPAVPAPPHLVAEWTFDGRPVCTGCTEMWVRPSGSGTFRVMDSLRRYCITSDDIELRVDRRKIAFVPTAFSPNGDGVNDYFSIFQGPAVSQVATFQVFDRGGGILYEATDTTFDDPRSGWDGRFNDREAQAGIYTYRAVLRLFDGEVTTMTGTVTLMK